MFAVNLQRYFGIRYLQVRVPVLVVLAVGYLTLRVEAPTVVDWAFAAAAVTVGGFAAAWPLAAALAQAVLLGTVVAVDAEAAAMVLVKIMAGFALFELAARRPARWAGLAAVVLLAASVAGKADRLPQELAAVLYGMVVVLGVPLLLGTQLRSAWRLAEQAEARAEAERLRAEAEIARRASDDRAARASERATIARELHDLVAHQIASILLRVGVAREVLPNLDKATVETFDDVHDCAATVLDDLRRLVGVLRSGEGISLIEPAGLSRAVAATVERARQLGLDITATVAESVGGIEAVRALTVLRLCQEGLTNVAKHGGPHARVALTIHHDTEDVIRLSIEDLPGAGVAPPPAAEATDRDSAPTGYGLVGMRERVELLGGQLDVGPTATGWRLCATLPPPTDSRADASAAEATAVTTSVAP